MDTNGKERPPAGPGRVHPFLDPGAPPSRLPDTADTEALLRDYVRRFNATDEELYANAIPNADAEAWMLANVPRFACPDKDV